jgi:hypothetical protein
MVVYGEFSKSVDDYGTLSLSLRRADLDTFVMMGLPIMMARLACCQNSPSFLREMFETHQIPSFHEQPSRIRVH